MNILLNGLETFILKNFFEDLLYLNSDACLDIKYCVCFQQKDAAIANNFRNVFEATFDSMFGNYMRNLSFMRYLFLEEKKPLEIITLNILFNNNFFFSKLIAKEYSELNKK